MTYYGQVIEINATGPVHSSFNVSGPCSPCTYWHHAAHGNDYLWYEMALKPTNSRITIDRAKRFGRTCVVGARIAVEDVLGWMASGMSHQAILRDFPELKKDDILACLAYAAKRERVHRSVR